MSAQPTDFNDLGAIAGDEAVKEAIAKAMAGAKAPPPPPPEANPLAPPQMRPEGFPPILKDIVDAACEHSEAHPVAVAANVLLWFSATVGRAPFQRIGDSVIHCRPCAIITGRTSKGRKGTAEALPRRLFSKVDGLLAKQNMPDPLRLHCGGLSTGEGIAWAIRDGREADDKGKGADEGVIDKRMLIIEPEFANLLSHCRREGNTLSPTVRNAWDGRDIEPLTKSATTRASKPHVVIAGHITGQELRERATESDTANGLLNRFMVLYVYRPKLVPLPQPTPAGIIDALARRLADAVTAATDSDLRANCTVLVKMDDDAEALWCEHYKNLSRDRDGKVGALLARTEVYARMLAMVFCLLGGRREIEPCDLRAAFAWVDYWTESAAYVFRTGDGEDDELTPFEIEVFGLVKKSPGIALSAIQEHWHRKRIKEVRAALERLSNQAPPLVVAKKKERLPSEGRAPMCYWPA